MIFYYHQCCQTYPYDQVSDVITYTVMPQRGQLQAFPPTAVIPFQYPLYKQCNVSWGSDIIETTTICAVRGAVVGGFDLVVPQYIMCMGSLTFRPCHIPAVAPTGRLLDELHQHGHSRQTHPHQRPVRHSHATPCAQPQHACTLLTRFLPSLPPNTRGSNPGTLNTWLRANGGYTQGNDLIESVVPKINPAHISWPPDAMHPTNDIPMTGIRTYLEAGRPVIANVMHVSSRAWSGAPTEYFFAYCLPFWLLLMQGHHFVLVIGYDKASNDTLYVNDPGFNKITYSYSEDVVGWRLFAMSME